MMEVNAMQSPNDTLESRTETADAPPEPWPTAHEGEDDDGQDRPADDDPELLH